MPRGTRNKGYETSSKDHLIDVKTNQCGYCGKVFANSQRLDYHLEMMVCFGKLYVCKRCFAVFDQPCKLTEHQRFPLVKCEPGKGVHIDLKGDDLIIERIV